MSVLKALSTHLSSTQQTAFHLEVGCKSNHTQRPHKAGSLTCSLKASWSLFTWVKFKEHCISEKGCPLPCVHMQNGVSLCGNWGQDRRKRLDSGGVGTAEVSAPVLSVGMKLIFPLSTLCILLFVSALRTHANTHTEIHHEDKTLYNLHRLHYSVHKPHAWKCSQRIHMAHTYKRGSSQENRPSYLLSSKFPRVEQARTCSELSRLSHGPAGTHAHRLTHMQAGWK